LPENKFISRCFCWMQLKRHYRYDKTINVTIIYQWPLLVLAMSSTSIATIFWNGNEFFWNIIQNKIYGNFWVLIILEVVLSMRVCRHTSIEISRWAIYSWKDNILL
jgi:hypothetical protein